MKNEEVIIKWIRPNADHDGTVGRVKEIENHLDVEIRAGVMSYEH